MATNLGLEFNKLAYKNLKSKPEQNVQYRLDNMALYDLLVKTNLEELEPQQLNLRTKIGSDYIAFSLTTSGQGLLIGTGNGHGTGAKVKQDGKVKESHEFKMGFYFDHSTGIPMITGHNLKGRLRSFFPIAYKKEKKDAVLKRLIEDLKDCFKNDEDDKLKNAPWDNNQISELQNSIFEGIGHDGKRINPLVQDAFLGTYPSKSNSKGFSYSISKKYSPENQITGNQTFKYDHEEVIKIPEGTFLFDDTLAYHPHPLHDPNPIKFLKIIPDVEITFQFRLNDIGLKKDKKKKLFEYLLLKYGAGAKTSSGYGQFKKQIDLNTNNLDYFKISNFKPINLNREVTKLPKPPIKTNPEWKSIEDVKLNGTLKATVISFDSGSTKVQLHLRDFNELKALQGKFEIQSEINVKIMEIYKDKIKGKFVISKIAKP